MNNNSYIFYGTESEWTQNASNFDFPYIAYTHDAGNVYISPFEGGSGGQQPEPVYQTFTYTRVFDNFKYLRDGESDPAGLYADVTIGIDTQSGRATVSKNQTTANSDGWQLIYNTSNDAVTISKQFTVDTTLTLQEQIASINNSQIHVFLDPRTTLYDNMGIELIWQGEDYMDGADLHRKLFDGSLQSLVSDYISTAGLNALTNITIPAVGMDELYEPDQNGSGTPFTAYNIGSIYYTGLNTIYDSTGARQTSIPMRIVFNGQTRDFIVGGTQSFNNSFNGLHYQYMAVGQDAGKLSLYLQFDYDVVLTDAEKIALLSNTDYTLYYTGSNIFTQAGDEYECGASSDSNGYIIDQFSEYSLLVQNGTVADSTQTYDIWENFTQAQGGSGTDMNIPVTYTIQNLNGMYNEKFDYDPTQDSGTAITVVNSRTHGEQQYAVHNPMVLQIFDTNEVSQDDIWDSQYAQYVHELTLDTDFTDTEICGALFSYDSANDELTVTYNGINFTSGTTASDVMSDTSTYENGIHVVIKGSAGDFWKYNIYTADGDLINTDKKWYDTINNTEGVSPTYYILNLSPLTTVYEIQDGEYSFYPYIDETIDMLADRFTVLKDYFYIQYNADTYDNEQHLRPGNNVLKLEYNNWSGTTPSSVNSFSLEYSLDNQQTWQTINVSQNNAGQILIPAHDENALDYKPLNVYFRAPENTPLSNGISDNQNYAYTFKNVVYDGTIDAFRDATIADGIECYACGNIMSLIYGEEATVNGADFTSTYTIPSSWCFNSLFRGLTTLTSAADIWMPSPLTEGCYAHMYQNSGVTGVTIKTPDYDMFNDAAFAYAYICAGCTNLTQIDLSASLLYNYEFSHAFDGCNNNNLGPVWIYKFAGPASGNTGCTDSWMNNFPASGTIYYDATDATAVTSLPTNSSSGIPSGWTTEAQNN